MAEVAKLPLDTMNEVLNVLGSLPYRQVADVIEKVRRDTVVENVPDPVENNEEEAQPE